MISATVHNQGLTLELDEQLQLHDGARVLVDVRPGEIAADIEAEWSDLGLSHLEETWSHPGDALYDDWRALYGVPAR